MSLLSIIELSRTLLYSFILHEPIPVGTMFVCVDAQNVSCCSVVVTIPVIESRSMGVTFDLHNRSPSFTDIHLTVEVKHDNNVTTQFNVWTLLRQLLKAQSHIPSRTSSAQK